MGTTRRDRRALAAVLTLIALFCFGLWYLPSLYRVQFAELTRVRAENGVYDLRGVDFSAGFVRLEGDVTYLPGILTPEAYAAREGEAVSGRPQDLPAATSRMVLLLPEDGVYTVVRSSVDYAHRVYIDGALRHQAGVPAETAEGFRPGYAEMALDVETEGGVLEILQQGANFVHREGGGHDGVYIGAPATMARFLALTRGVELVTLGVFLALCLAHLALYAVRRSYRANLLCALLCLTWAVRTGLTGSKTFYALWPGLPWQLAFRLEYLTLPAAFVLLVLLAREIFPSVPQRGFVSLCAAAGGLFALLCAAADTVFLSWALLGLEAAYTAAILYLLARFAKEAPPLARAGRLRAEQAVALAAYAFFMYAAVHDALYHLDVKLPLGFALTGLAMLVFAFFQMTAMLYGTMRQTALAHERERRALAETEMLAELGRLKNEFYTDMSHEMKTPLTVISVNAQFAAKRLRAGTAGEDVIADLDAVSGEARRLAQMVTSLVGLGRAQGTGAGREPLDLGGLVRETARIYESLLARRHNSLTAEVAPDLPPVLGNADQLIQVLINLLVNANRHTSGGRVAVRAEARDGRVLVRVSDTGEGIPPALLPHVFERFRRGDAGGSGLGLYICKSIVEAHGGEIGIESEPGKGTQAWFALPAREDGGP